MSGSFWKGKSVFVTGHTGFKGGWLALWLQRLGAKVSGYALPPSQELGIFSAARVADGISSTLADIRDAGALRSAMSAAKPQIALHLAAQPLVRASYADPAETYEVNVMGTVNFLEAVRATPSVRVAIVVTSDKCYENSGEERGFRESDRLGGRDPYSSSKACCELVTSSYCDSFFSRSGVALASARAGNVIGGGDWSADRLIPDMVRAWSRGTALRIRYPHAVRPWQHVLEPLRGYLMLAERLWDGGSDYAGGWNFGPRREDAWQVGRLVESGARLWGHGASWETDGATHPHEARYLELDCSKADARLGWQALLDTEEALALTVQWYRANAGGADMAEVTLRQIKHYEQLAAGAARKARVQPHLLKRPHLKTRSHESEGDRDHSAASLA